MWIKFDLEGMKFELNIDKYYPNQNLDGRWTEVTCNFEFSNVIKYKISHDEILLCCEVDEIRNSLERLLNNELNEIKEYQPCEPDLTFILNPKYDIRNDPNTIYVKPGFEIRDIKLQLRVNLWDDGLTDNYFSMTLYREDIDNLYTYLCYVTKKFDKDNPKVQELINSGIIYG